LLQSSYYYIKTESGAVHAAAACRLGDTDGYLVVSPDQRVAQFTRSVAHMRSDTPTLALLLYWKAVQTFGRNLPVVREARMPCTACGTWAPTGVFDPTQLCPACKVRRTVTCTSCGTEVRAEACLEDRCLSCWTVTSLLRRFGEAPNAPRGSFDETGRIEEVGKRTPAPRRRRVVMMTSAIDPESSDSESESSDD